LATTGLAATRTRRARTAGAVVGAAGRGVVGGKHRRIAGMAIGVRRARGPARATCATWTTTATAGAAAARRLAWTTCACRARVAVSRRAGVDAIRHVPAAERGRVALGQGALVLASLQRVVRLARGGFTGDRQAARRLARAAAAAAVFADV